MVLSNTTSIFLPPPHLAIGKHSINCCLATDELPLLNSLIEFTLQLTKSKKPNIKVRAHLVDNKDSGIHQGILEAKENANISVKIANNSEFDIHNLGIMLVNLAGSQVTLANNNQSIKKIAAHSTKVITIKINADKKLINKQLDFGVLVKSSSLLEDIKKSLTISAIPSIQDKKQ